MEEGTAIDMHTVYDVANWFLSKSCDITNKKLQKLAYYAYSWYLVFNNESVDDLSSRFFENKFEAWVHGAVYPELFHKYKEYGSSCIPMYKGETAAFSPDDVDVLNQTWEVYGKYNGNELESICHQESPWINARGNLTRWEPSTEAIKDKDIFECYAARL